MSETNLIPAARIERRILFLRGQKVMLDFDLAELYSVETRVLNQAVKRNLERFPEDFMFQLTWEETKVLLRSQIVTLAGETGEIASKNMRNPRSRIVTLESGQNLKYRPYAFTEQGVGMLSGVLSSPRAVQTHVAIIRAFVQLRQMLASNAGLARKLEALEKKYDAKFRIVFDAIREMMDEKKKPRREIGFHTLMAKPAKAGGAKAKKI
jgi:ORF6N domain